MNNKTYEYEPVYNTIPDVKDIEEATFPIIEKMILDKAKAVIQLSEECVAITKESLRANKNTIHQIDRRLDNRLKKIIRGKE
tara:strand:- start:252 stop:497 length:246 start_codon:yes stop_codon:yes gene_type:complete